MVASLAGASAPLADEDRAALIAYARAWSQREGRKALARLRDIFEPHGFALLWSARADRIGFRLTLKRNGTTAFVYGVALAVHAGEARIAKSVSRAGGPSQREPFIPRRAGIISLPECDHRDITADFLRSLRQAP